MAELPHIRGAVMMYDRNADVMVVQDPFEADLARLFGEHVDVREAVLRPEDDGSWPSASVGFAWPREGSAYYLEQIERDLFRRTELAAKEGYAVAATISGQDGVEVDLELTRRSFTGGEYQATLDAWTQRPMTVKTVVSTTVPVKTDRDTLVIWPTSQRPTEQPSAQVREPRAAGTPDWAVGTWRLETEHEGGGDAVPMIVRADGGGVISPDDTPIQISVDRAGRVSGQRVIGESVVALTGALAADGTGAGRFTMRVGQTEEQMMDWTATKVSGEVPDDVQASATAGPPPEWAVATWLVTAEGIEARMTVHEDGQGLIPFPNLPAHIRVDASGRVSTGEQLLPDVTVTVTGVLSADGTGSGVLSGCHGDEQAQVQWTATKVSGEVPEDDQAATTSSAPIRLAQLGGGGGLGGGSFAGGYGSGSRDYRSEHMRPMGLAVLLELRQWVYEPASQEMRREFEPLARALEQATDGRARLDLQQTQTPPEGQLTVVPIAVDGEAAPITVDGEEYVPVVGLRLADMGSAVYFYRHERGSQDQRTVSYDRDTLRFPAGASLLAHSPQEEGTMVVLVPEEDGVAQPAEERDDGLGGGYGSGGVLGGGPEATRLPEGAPELAFAEHIGWSSMRVGRDTIEGPQFRVWGSAPGGEAPRVSLDIVVRGQGGQGGSRGGYGGSSFGSSPSGSDSRY